VHTCEPKDSADHAALPAPPLRRGALFQSGPRAQIPRQTQIERKIRREK